MRDYLYGLPDGDKVRISRDHVRPQDWQECQWCGEPCWAWDQAWFIDGDGPYCGRKCAEGAVDEALGKKGARQ